MLNQKYCLWMDGFMESWKNLEGVKTIEWLAPDVKYYESPDGEPCSSLEEVSELWAIVPENQRDITYSYEVICSDESFCIFNWKMNRTLLTADKEVHQHINGIFQVAVNEDNKCTFFKQWRNTVTV